MQIAWDDAVERILTERGRTVLVLGAVDVGKSHSATCLPMRCCRPGAGYPDLSVPGGRTPPALLHFVGSTNAAGHFLPVAAGTAT
ncbi:MAG: hypothetical protein QOK29_3378, partial [Rhodospirillaceae bacterium]|nr:hypothetical protein [Rhodospirillaceae bacterium]